MINTVNCIIDYLGDLSRIVRRVMIIISFVLLLHEFIRKISKNYDNMKLGLHPKQYFNALRIIGKITAFWPLEQKASKIEVILNECKWWIAFLNASGLLIPLLLAIYYFRNDSFALTKALSEFTALCEVFLNLIQFKVKEKQFQIILRKIDQFIKNSNKYEDVILRKYIEKYNKMQMFVGLVFLANAFLFSCMPLITPQLLPADAWYPFSTEPIAIRTFLYFTQVLAIFQTGLGMVVDFIVAMMLWYSTVQLKLLEDAVTRAINSKQIKLCAEQHQQIITFTNNVKGGITFILLKSNILMLIVIVAAAFQLIQHEPIEVLLRFFILALTGCLRLYLCIKPANDLMEQCELLRQTVYETAYSHKSPESIELLVLFAFRCNKPIILSVQGVFEAYGLQYYCSFLYKSVTYFLNLRAVLDK